MGLSAPAKERKMGSWVPNLTSLPIRYVTGHLCVMLTQQSLARRRRESLLHCDRYTIELVVP